MRPIYIEMDAFGSYVHEAIDFSQVDHGLFLITGDTGAGKTTIFDAITFALYGETSGKKRDGKMMRSQYAAPNQKTQVRFRFLYAGETYEIIRTPEQPKYKKKKEGEGYERLKTNQQPTVQLILPNGEEYPGKLREVNARIEQLIGLNGEQFTQVAMLAQGDFMKLLLASSKERKEIFAKIFDTRLYGIVADLITKRFNQAKDALSKNQEGIVHAFSQISLVKDSAYEEVWNGDTYRARFSETDQEGLLQVVANICKETKERQKLVQSEKATVEKKLEQIQQMLDAANTINRQFEELEQQKKEQEKLQKEEAAIKDKKIQIENGERAAGVERFYEAKKGKEKEWNTTKQQLEQGKQWVELHKEQLVQLELKYKKAAQELEEKSVPLQNEQNRIQEQLPNYDKKEKLKEECKKLQEAIATEEKKKQQLEETLQKADAAYEGKEKELQTLQEQAKDLQVISLEEKQLAQRKQDIDALLVLEEKLKVLTEKEKKEGTILRQAQRRQQEIEEEYNRIYDVFMHNQAAFLRQQLQEGMPCPVCGSVHHEPKMWTEEENNKENVDKEYLKKMEEKKKKVFEERERANVGYERTKQEWKIKEEEWKRSKERLFGEKEVSLLEEQKQVKQQLEQCEKAKKKAEKDSIQIKQLEKWVENYQTKRGSHEKKMKDIAEQLTKQQVSLATLTAKYTAVSEQLPFAEKREAQERLHLLMAQYDKLVTAKKESQSRYEQEKAEMDKRQGQLQQLEKHADGLKKELESVIKAYEEQLLKAGFADTKQYQDAYLLPKDIERLRQEVSSFQEKQIRLTERIRHLTEQTAGKEPLDITEYKEKKEQLQEEKSLVERQGNEIYHLVTTNEEAKKIGKALYKERVGLLESGNVLQKLYNTVNGKLAGKHLTFQTYMQREFFKEIIERANMRLVKMSGQQFLLQCRNIEDLGAQGEVGLDLDIYSLMTDQVRDVKTLSGGESFLASLSMALGMADMIQNSNGAVHLDTMFIDEGFGSLSDETRNEAIDILNELSEGKRLVGIISHVSELKNQVGTKLIIEKTSRGSHHKWEMDNGIV